jgi:hypothetical protein
MVVDTMFTGGWALSQLLSYPPWWWLIWLVVAFGAARYAKIPGIVGGQFLIAGMISMLDLQWIERQMSRPGWNGLPDQDFVFYIGLFARIILINAVLLPVSVVGFWFRRRPAIASAAENA